jgi:MFS family permease
MDLDVVLPAKIHMTNGTAGRTYGWYFLGLLTLIYVMGAIDRGVISVIAEPLKSHFQLTDQQIGILGGIGYSATYAIAALPSGWLIDRGNRRNLLSITIAAWSFLTACSAFASSFAILMITRLAVGAAEAPITPGSLSLIADIFPKDRRSSAVSFYYAGTALGQIILFLLGGWLLMHFTWRSVFLVAGIPGLVLAALLLSSTWEPERGTFDAPMPKGDGGAKAVGAGLMEVARATWRNRALLLCIPAITIGSGVIYTVTVWSTSLFVRVHHMTVSQGLVWTGVGFGLCMAIGSVLVGPFTDRISGGDPRKIAVIAAVASILAIAAGIPMVLGGGEVTAVAGLAVFSFMGGVFYPAGFSIALNLAPADQRGSIMAGIRLISVFFGTGLLPIATGALSDITGSIQPALLFTILLLAISVASYAWIYRTLRVEGAR